MTLRRWRKNACKRLHNHGAKLLSDEVQNTYRARGFRAVTNARPDAAPRGAATPVRLQSTTDPAKAEAMLRLAREIYR